MKKHSSHNQKDIMKKEIAFQFDLNCRWAVYAHRIIAKIQATIDELKEEAEKAFADSCDDCLACVAVFSNGEAIYKRA